MSRGVIDAHQHVWTVGRHGFEWPTPDLAAIHRDWGVADLVTAAEGIDLVGTVLVQSQPSAADTDWLIEVAAGEPLVKAVVGWVDFERPDALREVEWLAAHATLRGLRPMLQNLPDDGWIARAAFDPVFDRMVTLGLTLDALIHPRHLPFVEARARRHPGLRIVIDHGAKPPIGDGAFAPWAAAIERIAALDSVFCKLSGLPTEMAAGQGDAALAPYIAHLVACFRPARLMWGSDWPVVNLACGYRHWFDTATTLSGLAGDDLDALCRRTAATFYAIDLEERPC